MARRKQRLPRYAKDLMKQASKIPGHTGRAYTVKICHDAWCDLLKGVGPCNCNPEVCSPVRLPSPKDN